MHIEYRSFEQSLKLLEAENIFEREFNQFRSFEKDSFALKNKK